MVDREHGDPVEQTFAAPDFRKQHHAEQEEVDVRAFADGLDGQIDGKQAQRYE